MALTLRVLGGDDLIGALFVLRELFDEAEDGWNVSGRGGSDTCRSFGHELSVREGTEAQKESTAQRSRAI